MTRSQIMRLLAVVAANYGEAAAKITDEKIAIWYRLLSCFDLVDVANAVAAHIAESRWAPTVADIRSRIVRVVLPDVDQALAEVEKATRGDHVEFSAPEIREAYRALGLDRGAVLTEQMPTIRAQFRDVYTRICERRQRAASEAALPAASEPRLITGGDK